MDSFFDRLFAAEVSWVHRTLLRLGVAPRDVEDGVQEVFLAVYRKLPECDRDRALRPWLFAFVYHYAANYRRLSRHRRETTEHGEHEEARSATDPERELAHAQARALVLRALEDLPDERRAVFVAHELDGLTPREIATAMSVPVDTVYSRLRVARDEFARAAARVTARERARTREGEAS